VKMLTVTRTGVLALTTGLMLMACTPASQLSRTPATEEGRAPAAEEGPPPEQRMHAAEARYRQALILLENGNPHGMEESDQALEDMEDALHACARTAGCGLSHLLASYKRLLKQQADEALAFEDSSDHAALTDSSDDAPADLPAVTDIKADSTVLLSADDRRFIDMVQMNPAVQAGIRRWLTDMRASLITSHENYQYMQHLMSPEFREHGLPEALLFGIMTKESNGRVHSRSRAGAAGLLQFMPNTGRRFGLGVNADGFDTRYDPQQSANAAARYLRERLQELGPNIEYWLAAYNGGEGRARQVHKRSEGRSFWEEDVYAQFPPETRDYVPMVIAAAWLYLHPEDYGLRFPEVDPTPATITLARSASIYELTICLGNGDTRDGYLRVLRNLNPGYSAETWIPAGTVLNATARMAALYPQTCIEGPRAELARRLIESDPNTAEATAGQQPAQPILQVAENRAAAQPARTRQVRTHQVKRGETLGGIANQHRCTLRTLAAANNISGPRYFLRVGQQLRLEGCRR